MADYENHQGYQRIKEYQIPHNFQSNGRIFNMIEKEALTKSLIWIVPITLIVFNLPMRIDNKFFVEVLIGAPPALAFSMGLDVILMDRIKFKRNRKIYYNLGSEVGKNENNRYYQGAYERAKKQEIAAKGKQ